MSIIIAATAFFTALAGGLYAWDRYTALPRQSARAEMICIGTVGGCIALLMFACGFLTAELWRSL
jgi:hypothetical protein